MFQKQSIAIFLILFFIFNEVMVMYPITRTKFGYALWEINVRYKAPKSKFISLFKLNQTFTNKRKDLVLFYGEKMKDFVPQILPITDFLNDQSNHFHGNFVRAKNMYVSGGYIITDGITIYQLRDCTGADFMFKNNPGRVIGHYTDVLLVGHVATNIFAHFINELMNPTLLFPEEIRKKSHLVVKGPPNMWKDITSLFGFEGRTILLTNSDWIYCENLYTIIEPSPHGGFYGPALYHLHGLFREKFNLTHIVPTKIGFLNRKGKLRIISNYDVLIEAAKKKYPKEIFFSIPDTLVAFEAAKTYASCRILMTVTGSSCINVIYMAEKTCIIKLTSPTVDMCNIIVPNSLNIYQVNLYYPTMSMYSPSVTALDINESLKALELAFYVTEHNKWPTIKEFKFIM
ncbi:hypothetical protein TVAG_324500 [Trichomonas vaginalis G3]|uniref:Glycosyltransferase 61 catalytic domain-containing protein n=1 Tax=Trichomonas vaginalis (strain ATCC PRA-98 / G3) TaxID=412133 RepID=A2FFQ1_TRIV3|nr:glycosyltransferase family [Trichomonas vaginalis G3]EAX96276.1 hypothetical protein TVAG_324500 [Trichomonas vaginalis G3]KAI5516279.1 glycosyltransferase family [Trichomonas vaginalis G3]|eukprot:XP_001309206.1 hypothetical protein [Trichomonas vaginalis G3]